MQELTLIGIIVTVIGIVVTLLPNYFRRAIAYLCLPDKELFGIRPIAVVFAIIVLWAIFK